MLSALGQPEMAIMAYEIIGDEALADGDAEFAERAFREGSLLAYEEYLRLSLTYSPRIQGPGRIGFRCATTPNDWRKRRTTRVAETYRRSLGPDNTFKSRLPTPLAIRT